MALVCHVSGLVFSVHGRYLVRFLVARPRSSARLLDRVDWSLGARNTSGERPSWWDRAASSSVRNTGRKWHLRMIGTRPRRVQPTTKSQSVLEPGDADLVRRETGWSWGLRATNGLPCACMTVRWPPTHIHDRSMGWPSRYGNPLLGRAPPGLRPTFPLPRRLTSARCGPSSLPYCWLAVRCLPPPRTTLGRIECVEIDGGSHTHTLTRIGVVEC